MVRSTLFALLLALLALTFILFQQTLLFERFIEQRHTLVLFLKIIIHGLVVVTHVFIALLNFFLVIWHLCQLSIGKSGVGVGLNFLRLRLSYP